MIKTAFNTYVKFNDTKHIFDQIFGPNIIKNVYVLKLFGPLDLILAAKATESDPDKYLKLDRQDIILELANNQLVQLTAAVSLGASMRSVNPATVSLEGEDPCTPEQ